MITDAGKQLIENELSQLTPEQNKGTPIESWEGIEPDCILEIPDNITTPQPPSPLRY